MEDEGSTPDPLDQIEQMIYGVAVSTRAQAAYELHLGGKTLQEVCDELNYTSTTEVAHAINSRIRIGAAFLTEIARAGMVQMSLDRLARLRAAAWPAAMTGDPRSIMAVLAIEDREIKVGQLDSMDAVGQANTVLVISGNEKSYVDKLRELSDG